MLIDTHCHLHHLDLTDYNNNLDVVLENAKKNGVSHIVCVCLGLDDFPKMLEISEKYPNVYLTIGVHPSEDTGSLDIEKLIKLGEHEKVIGIGETGLDYYRKYNLDRQKSLFITQIKAALKLNKPLIVHSRDAREDTMSLLKDEKAEKIGGIMHCFTGSLDMAKEAIDLNFYISFSGIITFNSAKDLRNVAKEIPLDRILIETDSPYLAPIPFRGKQNEPAFVKYVAEKLAEIRNVDLSVIEDQTTKNFYNLFDV